MLNIIKKIVKYILFISILSIIGFLIFMQWYLNPVGKFEEIKTDPEIGKKIIFLVPFIKVKDTCSYMRDDFLDKYNDFIIPKDYIYPNEELLNSKSKQITQAIYGEKFLVKGAFRFKRRGTTFAPSQNSKYYILEDSKKDIYVVEIWKDKHGKDYQDVRKIVD